MQRSRVAATAKWGWYTRALFATAKYVSVHHRAPPFIYVQDNYSIKASITWGSFRAIRRWWVVTSSVKNFVLFKWQRLRKQSRNNVYILLHSASSASQQINRLITHTGCIWLVVLLTLDRSVSHHLFRCHLNKVQISFFFAAIAEEPGFSTTLKQQVISHFSQTLRRACWLSAFDMNYKTHQHCRPNYSNRSRMRVNSFHPEQNVTILGVVIKS